MMPKSMECSVFDDANDDIVNVKCVVCLVGSNGENIAFGMRYFELPGGGQ